MANQSCGIGCTFQLGFGGSSAGVFVLKVREGGPADTAGISAGDRLLGFFLDSKVSVVYLLSSLYPALSFPTFFFQLFPVSDVATAMSIALGAPGSEIELLLHTKGGLKIVVKCARASDSVIAPATTRSIMGRFKAGSPVPLSQVFAFFDSNSDGVWSSSEFAAFKKDYLAARGSSVNADTVNVAASYLQNSQGLVTFESFRANFQYLEKPRSALLIIDVQNDFCPPSGSLAVAGGTDIIPGINELRKRLPFDVVAHSRDFHPANHCSFVTNNPGSQMFSEHKLASGEMQMMWPAHCVQGTQGSEFHPDLLVAPTDIIVHKGLNADIDSYSAFFDNGHKSQTEMEAL
jgi:hypothetical protein